MKIPADWSDSIEEMLDQDIWFGGNFRRIDGISARGTDSSDCLGE